MPGLKFPKLKLGKVKLGKVKGGGGLTAKKAYSNSKKAARKIKAATGKFKRQRGC